MIIIQIGCFCYIDQHIKDYATNSNNKLYLLDANPMAIQKINNECSGYSNIHCFNLGVSNEDTIIPFYLTGMGVENDYVASFSYNHVCNHHHNNITPIDVKSVKLKTFCEINLISKIDILYIDAESYESLIIKDIIQDNLNVECIVFETLHIDLNLFLKDMQLLGYKLIKLDHANSCLTKSIIPEFKA